MPKETPKGLHGADRAGGTPLPIPNREVKPCSADDTAIKCGKVGKRQDIIEKHSFNRMSAFFFYSTCASMILVTFQIAFISPTGIVIFPFFTLSEYKIS